MFENTFLCIFRPGRTCVNPKILFSEVKDLEEDIFVYAKKNLAVVNVYIKDPVVTRIMRDQV